MPSGEGDQEAELVVPCRNETDATSPATLGVLELALGARASVELPAITRMRTSASATGGVASGPVTVTSSTTSPTSGGGLGAFRVAVRPSRVVGAPVLGAVPTSRTACPVTSCRATSAKEGSTLRVPVSQARRASAVPISTSPKASGATAALLGKAQDGTPSARRSMGGALVTDA